MNAAATIKPHYATEAKIVHAIRAARKAGLDVVAFDALPDGTIRILDARAMPAPAESSDADDLFEALDAAGKL